MAWTLERMQPRDRKTASSEVRRLFGVCLLRHAWAQPPRARARRSATLQEYVHTSIQFSVPIWLNTSAVSVTSAN
jgi:hypothetical protein